MVHQNEKNLSRGETVRKFDLDKEMKLPYTVGSAVETMIQRTRLLRESAYFEYTPPSGWFRITIEWIDES